MDSKHLTQSWCLFYLSINNHQLDVSHFKIKSYGLNLPFEMDLGVLIDNQLIPELIKLNQQACLSICPKLTTNTNIPTPKYFHGLIVNIVNSFHTNVPNGYSHYHLSLRCDIWHRLKNIGCRNYHRLDFKSFCYQLAEDLNLASDRLQLKSLPTEKKSLRMLHNQSWQNFLIETLAKENIYCKTSFNSSNSQLEFSDCLINFCDQSKSTPITEVEQHFMTTVDPNENRLCYNVQYQNQIESDSISIFLDSYDYLAYPGELLHLNECEKLRVHELIITGEHPLNFNNDHNLKQSNYSIKSKIKAKPVNARASTKQKVTNKNHLNLYTGYIESTKQSQVYSERTSQGGYQVRIDIDEPSASSSSETNLYKATAKAHALTNVKNQSLMPGHKHGIEFPLYNGTEVLLALHQDQSEPAVILGCLHNKNSESPVTEKNHFQNIIKTRSGKHLILSDKKNKPSITLANYQNQLYLFGDQDSLTIKSQQGSLNIKSQQQSILTAKNTAHIYAQKFIKLLSHKNINIIAKHNNIQIKTCNELNQQTKTYKLNAKEVNIQAKNKLGLKANNKIQLNTQRLTLNSLNKDIQISAKKIIIRANKLDAYTPGSNFLLQSKKLDLMANSGVLAIQKLNQSNIANYLGGLAQPAQNREQKNTKSTQLQSIKSVDNLDLSGNVKKSNQKPQAASNMQSSNINQDIEYVKFTVPFKAPANKHQPEKRTHQAIDPIIINLQSEQKSAADPALLSESQLSYFKENGNSITLFIHGYNVPLGAFNKEIIDVKNKVDGSVTRLKQNPYKYPHVNPNNVIPMITEAVYSDRDYSYYQDRKAWQSYYPDSKDGIAEQINGSGLHSWLVYLEHHLNHAAHQSLEQGTFTRCAFIAWPGAPENPADYILAAEQSRRYGPKLASLVSQIKTFSADMQITVIAHSQGNGVLIKALDYLGKHQPEHMIDFGFFWQAAIPGYSFSNNPRYQNCPWYSPDAIKAVKHITVFRSENDAILGPLLLPREQAYNINYETVYNRKPDEEMLFSFFTRFLGLGSLYQAAMHLQVPLSMILDPKQIDSAWQLFIVKRCTHNQSGTQVFKPTLKQQIEAIEGNALYRFSCKIANDLKQAKNEINDLKQYMKARTFNIAYGLSLHTIYQLLCHCDLVIETLFAKEHAISRNRFMLPGDRAGIMMDNSLKRMSKYQIYHVLPHFDKLIAFLYSALVLVPIEVSPAMGYDGLDLDDIPPDATEKFHIINTTKWVYHHSDMKHSSPDIDKEIYQDRIINRNGLQFGNHIGQGTINE